MGKIFFLKLIVLLAPVVLAVGFFEYNLAKIPTSYSIKKEAIEKNASEIQMLILGSSHAIAGINPDFLSLKAVNMADTSQSLYYDLGIFSKYATKLKNLEFLIIPVSYFSLQYNFDTGPEYWRAFFYDRFYGIPPLQKSRWLDIRKYSLFALYGQQRSLLYALKGFRVSLAPNILSNGYQRDDTNDPANTSEAAGKRQADLHASIMDSRLIPQNVQYLERMIALAKTKNAKPVLVTLPVSLAYSNNIDKAAYLNMVAVLNTLSREQDIPYFNHFQDRRFGKEDFSDADHLNSRGAEKFTTIMGREIGETRSLRLLFAD